MNALTNTLRSPLIPPFLGGILTCAGYSFICNEIDKDNKHKEKLKELNDEIKIKDDEQRMKRICEEYSKSQKLR